MRAVKKAVREVQQLLNTVSDVWLSPGSVTVQREVCQVLERYVSRWRGVMVIGGCKGM